MSFISYLSILIFSLLLSILPRNISLILGKMFGLAIYRVFPIRKKVALKNIQDNFTKLTNKEHLNILKNTYIHFGIVFSEFIRQQTLNINNINSIINIDQKTIETLNKNKGSIIMTGHIGNWEYFLPLFGLNNLKFSIVAQRIKNPYLNNLFLKIRSFKNVEIIFKSEGKDKMLKALKDDYHLGLASDQNAGRKGVDVQFLNHKISIPKGAAIFHIKTKKPIFIGYCIMKKNYTYEFKLKLLDTSDINFEKQDAIKEINRKFTKSLEKIIKKYPNQYFWFHKMRNKGEYTK